MKQEIISYLSTLKDDLYDISKYLYDNPEESFKEYKAYNYIVNLLKKYNFKVQENYLGINTSFYATFGKDYPKICYICEYDADPNHGHISGNNLVSTMSIGAAISLSKVISKLGGSIVVLGCPGEYLNGCKTTMVKQGTFEDVDAVLMAHPNKITTKTLPSKAVLPIKIKYGIPSERDVPPSPCTATHCSILTYNFIDLLNANLPNNYNVQNITTHGMCNPYLISSSCENTYLITTSNIKHSDKILDIIKSFTSQLGDIFGLDTNVSIHQLPYEDMIPNKGICRIFSHNLKEAGIIDVDVSEETLPGLSLGSVSHVVPCINPFINITENSQIQYPSGNFAKETIKDFAIIQTTKAIQALALTGLDLIENNELLREIKDEFNRNTKK